MAQDNLEAHHILPKTKFPQYALDLENGRTMCYDCHKTIHKQGGF
jgi:predicted HNH restriction endonuclease